MYSCDNNVSYLYIIIRYIYVMLYNLSIMLLPCCIHFITQHK